MDEKQVLNLLQALSQETRLLIVRYLVRRGEEGASAGEVAQAVEAQSSRASFHLSALEKAGAITSERRSRSIIYRADLRNLGGLMSFLLKDCCNDDPVVRACCEVDADCCS